MEAARRFREKLRGTNVCLGTYITFCDAAVCEALAPLFDFLWIDMEHTPVTLPDVQAHLIAMRASCTAALVRVAANDPNLVKPVLDMGADGIVIPLVRTADDVRQAVAACQYPPAGVRGFGPRRAADYGRIAAEEYCRAANETVICIAQIEQAEAVENLDAIMAVPGLTSLIVGPNDLAASLGYTGQPGHPEVVKTIEGVVARARTAGMPLGLAVGDDVELIGRWIELGVSWLMVSADFLLLTRTAAGLVERIRSREKTGAPSAS